LKYGLFRLRLNSAGDNIDSSLCINAVDTFPLLHSWRVRDIAISPNGGYIWVITDSSGSTSGPTGGFNGSSSATKSPGMVLRLTYKNLFTLPVNFITFDGRLTPEKKIQLTWKAMIDQEHRYFDIEKSFDGNNFFPIGRNHNPPYRFIDDHPAIGHNYYRLKAVDVNNHFIYSNIIDIIYKDALTTVSAYPNPVQNVLNVKINSNTANAMKLEIINLVGKKVFQKDLGVASNISTTIDTRLWKSGIYILKIVNDKNEVINLQKLVRE
jgi:hypothetical protein